MERIRPVKIGEIVELFPRQYGKTLGAQKFLNPESNEMYDYILYLGNPWSSVVIPFTDKNEVILINQFRYGADDFVYEFPGGNQKFPKETPAEVARRELLEETGYEAGEMALLTDSHTTLDPASYVSYLYPYIALNCKLVGSEKPDDFDGKIEVIERVQILPFDQWLEMVREGKVIDIKSITLTYLALMHLKYKIVPPVSVPDLKSRTFYYQGG